MSNKKRVFIFGVLALFIALGVGYYNIKNDIPHNDATGVPVAQEGDVKTAGDSVGGGKEAPQIPAKITDDTAGGSAVVIEKKSQKDSISGIEYQTPQAGELASVAVSVTMPYLDRTVVFPDGYSEEESEKIRGYIAILTDALKEDHNRFNEWMDLAILRKSIGDYEGALQAWEYASAIRPGNSLSFANLGMLYGYYLSQPLKAEANFLHAIENEPRLIEYYAKIMDFYLEVMKDKGRAADFLDRAISKYPEWAEIKELRVHITE